MMVNKIYMDAGRLVLEGDPRELGKVAFGFKAPCEYEVKKIRKRRSLDANAYAWHLIGKIADKVGADKDLIYIIMLERYGQGGMAKLRRKDVPLFQKQWKYSRKHSEAAGDTEYWRFWVGSSKYDTREMSIFIDGIINECRDLDLETESEGYVKSLLASWAS